MRFLRAEAINKSKQTGSKSRVPVCLLCLCCLLWQVLLPLLAQAHDEMGHKVWQTDANNHATRFGYDERGRMVWRAMPGGQVERMSYNDDGQLESSTDFRGFVTRYAYDLRGRMTLKQPDARLNEATLTWSYPNENTRIATRGSLQTTYTSNPQRGWLQSVQSPTGTLSYGYDDGGEKTSVTSPSGLTSYSYDVLGRVQNVYDQPTGTSNPTAIASYDYDNVGNLKSVSRGNGIVTSYGYDELNRLSDLVNAKGASEVSRFHYAVRADGKRTGLTERLVNADLVNNAPRVSNWGVSYGYDDAGRLTGETGDDGAGVAYQTSYTYDKVGNRTDTLYKRATTAAPNTFSHTTTVASVFNANDWLTGQSIQTDGGAVQTQSYTYDRSGSQLTEQNGSNTPQENDWGFDGKLQGTKAQGQSTGGTTYTTDAAGNRIGVTLNTGLAQQKTTRYLVDENTSYASVVEERAPDTNDTAAQELQARYVWGQGLAPLAMWRKGSDGTVKLFFMLTDGQDSVRQLTNSSGSVTDSYFYDAWGNGLAGGSGSTVNPFRYTGQQLDPSGKYFLRARYYDPGNGRFLSHDPVMGSSDDPLSLHRYVYGANDGVNFSDPSGNESLAGVMTSIGVNARLASTLSSALTIGSRISSVIQAGNIVADYALTGTINPTDLLTLGLDLASPYASKLLFRGIRGIAMMKNIGTKPAITAPANELRQVALDALDGDFFKKARDSYNSVAGAKGLPPIADVEQIREALMNRVTMYRSSGGQSAIWSKSHFGRFKDVIMNNPTEYWLQFSDKSYYAVSAERAVSHELLHLGAMLNGQKGGLLWGTAHEVGVTALTTTDTVVDMVLGTGILAGIGNRAATALMDTDDD